MFIIYLRFKRKKQHVHGPSRSEDIFWKRIGARQPRFAQRCKKALDSGMSSDSLTSTSSGASLSTSSSASSPEALQETPWMPSLPQSSFGDLPTLPLPTLPSSFSVGECWSSLPSLPFLAPLSPLSDTAIAEENVYLPDLGLGVNGVRWPDPDWKPDSGAASFVDFSHLVDLPELEMKSPGSMENNCGSTDVDSPSSLLTPTLVERSLDDDLALAETLPAEIGFGFDAWQDTLVDLPMDSDEDCNAPKAMHQCSCKKKKMVNSSPMIVCVFFL